MFAVSKEQYAKLVKFVSKVLAKLENATMTNNVLVKLMQMSAICGGIFAFAGTLMSPAPH